MIDIEYWKSQADKYELQLNIRILSDFMMIDNIDEYISKTALVLQDVTEHRWFVISEGNSLGKMLDSLSDKEYENAIDIIKNNISSEAERGAFEFFIETSRLMREFEAGRYYQTIHYTLKGKKENHRLKISMLLVKDEATGHLLAFTIINQVDEIFRWIERIRKQAQIDPLTDVLNRSAYREDVARYLAVMSEDSLGAVVEIDADYFKDINDKYGHEVGDKALIALAQRLQEVFYKKKDSVYRVGGDEFVVLVLDTYHDGVIEALERLVSKPIEFDCGDGVTDITVSAGCTFFKAGTTEGEIYNNTDSALYDVKKSGRNAYRIYGA